MNPYKVEMTKYNILRKGKVIFWDVSQSELFDRLEDYAVESYVTGSPKPSEITYEVSKEDKWQNDQE